MHNLILQDWTTTSGQRDSSCVQSDADYLDLGPYQDAVIWLDVRDYESGGGGAQAIIAFESSPLKEADFFSPNGGGFIAGMLVGVGVSVLPALLNNRSTQRPPLARWLRWAIESSGGNTDSTSWSITFRVLVAAHTLSL
jgi:hypothetical protein